MLPTGTEPMPMPAVRGLATDPDPAVRRAAYDAELRAWPTIDGAGGRCDQRDQGRSQRAQPAATMDVTARCLAVRQRRADRRSTPCRPR